MNNKQVIFNSIGDGTINLSSEFISLFPQLTQLLSKASKVEFTLNGNQRFRQYIWTNSKGQTSGWLCKLEHCIPQGRNLIDEHILLANTMGGIIDYWVDGNIGQLKSFIQANNFTFCLTDSHTGIIGWEDTRERCKMKAIASRNVSDYVTFALEANGNSTFYNHKTKEVFVYLHDDYSPFDTEPICDCPIYRYREAKTFVDYVELLAKQWQEALSN